jgi:NAD-dependent deacetylase
VSPADQVRGWLASARSVAVLTGAGISAESGVPTFRGAGGLWKTFRAEELATPQAFARDPHLVWEWYEMRRQAIASVQPNAGHRALAEFERRVPKFALVTQNVDGLHLRAGSKHVLRIHGDIWTLRCTACGSTWENLESPLPVRPPLCSCGAMARPGVVWFGESLPEDVWQQATDAVRTSDLVFVVGTSSVVYPAAGLIPLAKSNGARVVEINVEDTPMTGLVDVSWKSPAAVALPELL